MPELDELDRSATTARLFVWFLDGYISGPVFKWFASLDRFRQRVLECFSYA
jgi:hypothetical protein